MQKYHDQQQEEFYRSIDHMNQYGLRRKLEKPRVISATVKKPCFQEKKPEPSQEPSPSTSFTDRFDNRLQRISAERISTGTRIRSAIYERYQRAGRSPPLLRCYKCQSTDHLLYDCLKYRCSVCHEWAPGHKWNECPE